MSTPPPPGYPPTPPPTAQHPVPGEASPDQPVSRPQPRVSPVLTGISGVAVGAGLTLAIVLPLTVGAGDGSPPGQATDRTSTVLVDAAEACGSPDGVTIEDSGTTLAFDHRGEDEYTGGDIAEIVCVLTELDMPTRISTHMGQTTSMDGRQTASWDGWEIQWSYHPDRGMDGMVTLATD